MEKKTLGVVIALGILLVGIIVAVFIYDAALNTVVLDVNGVKYDKSDFESYLKVWQYENGEEALDLDQTFSNYQIYKLYSQYIDHYGVKLNSENEVKELTDTEKNTLETDYNLTESEYTRVKTEIALVDQLYGDLHKYYTVSDADYEEHKGENADKFKMYDYRVLQVAVEQPKEESGDSSGDSLEINVSGEILSGDALKAIEEQVRKDEAKSKAVEALAKVQSGDKFEDVAKEYGVNRIAYSQGGYSVVNGTLESISALYMEDFIWDENVIKALNTLQKGEYSEIYEGDSSYSFVYLEDVRDGLDEYDDNLYRKQIANEHIQGEAIIVPNKITLKSIKLDKIIPALIKEVPSGDEEEHDHEHEEAEDSANTNQTASGEVVSGEIIVSGENE